MGFKTILVPIEQHDLMNSTFWGFVNGGEQWRTGLWRSEGNWDPTFSVLEAAATTAKRAASPTVIEHCVAASIGRGRQAPEH